MALPLAAGTKALEPRPSPDPELETDASEVETAMRTHRRFDRAARLLTEPGLHRVMRARVLVVGVGGVGSFAAEALARTGVGELRLIDFDKVCITNSNRQLHAMKGTIGKRKVDVMAERLRAIHPTGDVIAVPEFYNADSSARLLDVGPVDYVIDCIDNLTAKVHLIAACVSRGIPVVSSMGAAARIDPTLIRTGDLSQTTIDPFARQVRKLLRTHDIFVERDRPSGIGAVWSTESPIEPTAPEYDAETGFQCVCPGGKNGLNDCDKKRRIDGTVSFVTGSFGLAAAGVVVRALSGITPRAYQG